jgi:hypothetical protein
MSMCLSIECFLYSTVLNRSHCTFSKLSGKQKHKCITLYSPDIYYLNISEYHNIVHLYILKNDQVFYAVRRVSSFYISLELHVKQKLKQAGYIRP